MDTITPFDWHRIFIGEEPLLFYAEILFRTVFIYLWALVLIRFMGKRGSRNMSPMENLVIIALGSSTGDSMFYPQIPLTYAMVVIAMIVLMSRGFALLQLHSRKANYFIDGFPLIMIREGKVIDESLKKARMRDDEINGMLRTQGYESTDEIKLALMERSGQLSIFTYEGQKTVMGESTWPEGVENPKELKGATSYDDLS